MNLPLQVTFEDLEPTDAIRNHIEAHAEKLGRLCRSITHLRVAIAAPHRHSFKRTEFRVRIELKLPRRKPIIVRAVRSDDLYDCIAEAFDTAERLLGARRRIRPRLDEQIRATV